MKQYRSKGSILGFVLVGALLTALVVGGVFAAKRYIDQNQTSDTDSATVAEAPATETQKPAETKTTAPASEDSDLKKALEQQSAAEKKAQDQKAASEATTKAASTPASTNTASLPTTGPEDSLAAMAGATLLAATGVAYRRSRALI
jgi:septal ring-binding cell division protein DamX